MRIAGNDLEHLRRTQQLGTRFHGQIEQTLLHLRMIEIEKARPCRRRLDKIAIAVRHRQPSRLVSAIGEQAIVDAKLARFSYAPRQHALAAHAVTEHRLTLDDESACAGSRHCCREGRTRESAADDHQIEVHPRLLPWAR
jgi:hypothetical protein